MIMITIINFMKNNSIFKLFSVSLLFLVLTGCSCEILEISFDEINTTFEKSKAKDKKVLGQKTVLYLDHSTCVIDAVNNSDVWKAVFQILRNIQMKLVLIKGSEI
jgi:hypothetical protein